MARKFREMQVMAFVFVVVMLVSACTSRDATAPVSPDAHDDHEAELTDQALSLPDLSPLDLEDKPLSVVATTSIIGDVVARVGGDSIELLTLMGAGQDPHSFEATPREMTTVAQADVTFVNGWNLEENLLDALKTIAGDVPMIPVSANIQPLEFMSQDPDEDDPTDGHEHTGADPHTWFSIHHVEQWTANITTVLSALDPTHADIYSDNAQVYLGELASLADYAEVQFAALPESRRYLVTNHQSLNYLAQDYGLHIVGTVIPAASTLAEPSPRELADLISVMEEYAVCVIFTETTVSDKLAVTVTEELDGCTTVQVVKLYTGSIGLEGSGADSYLGMMRHNIDAIIAGLQ